MKYFFQLLCFTFLLTSLGTKATIVPLQDRVVFSGSDIDRRLLIVNNDSHAPVLLKSWIDDGDSGDLNKEKNYPFVVIPAIAKMSPGRLLNLRILPTERVRALPADRESVFWINLYEIPGVIKSQQDEKSNKMEVGLISQLKIIYRPFKESVNIKDIANSLLMRVAASGDSLELANPSPYYVTPVSIKVKSTFGEQTLKLGMTRMIAPFSNKRFGLTNISGSKKTTVELTLTDDAGKDSTFIKSIN